MHINNNIINQLMAEFDAKIPATRKCEGCKKAFQELSMEDFIQTLCAQK